MEKLLITEALRRHQGSRKKAARQLGIDPSTLYRKLKTLRIDPRGENDPNKEANA